MVQNAIEKLMSGKACGNDEMPNTLCMPIGAYLYFCWFSITELSLVDIFMKTIIIPLI